MLLRPAAWYATVRSMSAKTRNVYLSAEADALIVAEAAAVDRSCSWVIDRAIKAHCKPQPEPTVADNDNAGRNSAIEAFKKANAAFQGRPQ